MEKILAEAVEQVDRVEQVEQITQAVALAVDEVSIKNFYEFRVPATTVVGDGISAHIGSYLTEIKARKVFIVTDPQIVALGLMNTMLRSLKRSQIEFTIFDKVEPDPSDMVVCNGIVELQNCGCDTVVAFGGGSAIDAGKAIAVFCTNSFNPANDVTNETHLNPRLPLMAVPTTAGTGSEVTSVCVITDSISHRKVPHQHPAFLPDIAVIDPVLTTGIPPRITAATGLDVLTHAIESYLARGVCTLGQALSYNAIQLVSSFLRIAVGEGSHMEARHKMAVASYMAGMSFSNAGLGLCHAMAHQIGTWYKVPHGVANALVLPEVMRFNMLVREDRLGMIARAFNQRTDNLAPREAALKGIEAVQGLIAEVGLPTRLNQVGADPAHFEAIAERALLDPTLLTNPRTVRQADIVELFNRCL